MEQVSNTTVKLHWYGPIRAGNLSSSFSSPLVDQPHVYLILLRYPAVDKIATYVGRCRNLRERIRGHLRDTLSLGYWLRDEQANWVYDPKDWAAKFDALDDILAMAATEVKRYEVYAAPCDASVLNLVEGALIRRLFENSDGTLICDNTRAEKHDAHLIINHSAETAEVTELLAQVIGEKTVR